MHFAQGFEDEQLNKLLSLFHLIRIRKLFFSSLFQIFTFTIWITVWFGQLCDMSDEGSLGGIFMLCIDHPSAMMNAHVSNFHHGNTLHSTWEWKGRALARMRRQESEPNTNFLNLQLCWNDCERWWMTDITLKCLLSLRIILPIFRWT